MGKFKAKSKRKKTRKQRKAMSQKDLKDEFDAQGKDLNLMDVL